MYFPHNFFDHLSLQHRFNDWDIYSCENNFISYPFSLFTSSSHNSLCVCMKFKFIHSSFCFFFIDLSSQFWSYEISRLIRENCSFICAHMYMIHLYPFLLVIFILLQSFKFHDDVKKFSSHFFASFFLPLSATQFFIPQKTLRHTESEKGKNKAGNGEFFNLHFYLILSQFLSFLVWCFSLPANKLNNISLWITCLFSLIYSKAIKIIIHNEVQN